MSGDRAILCAAHSKFDFAVQTVLMHAARAAHYLAWARRYFDAVQGRVGFSPGSAFHLWHGQVKDRLYQERHRRSELVDPYTDIALDKQGCWRWNSNKPEMHALVQGYFGLRDEDGSPHGG